jgi:hypothetical protein
MLHVFAGSGIFEHANEFLHSHSYLSFICCLHIYYNKILEKVNLFFNEVNNKSNMNKKKIKEAGLVI